MPRTLAQSLAPFHSCTSALSSLLYLGGTAAPARRKRNSLSMLPKQLLAFTTLSVSCASTAASCKMMRHVRHVPPAYQERSSGTASFPSLTYCSQVGGLKFDVPSDIRLSQQPKQRIFNSSFFQHAQSWLRTGCQPS